MLFNIYLKPLGKVVRSFGVQCHQYADDTKLYLSFPPNFREAVLVSVMGWMRANKLKVNPDKTEVLLVSWKADEGIGILLVLDGVIFPLKPRSASCVYSWIHP